MSRTQAIVLKSEPSGTPEIARPRESVTIIMSIPTIERFSSARAATSRVFPASIASIKLGRPATATTAYSKMSLQSPSVSVMPTSVVFKFSEIEL